MSNPTFIPAEDSLILGCVDEATAYVVDDYPYGRQRTQIRYWIESKPKFGDRFMAQTKNPKTGRWNKPKAGTYSPLLVMYLQEQEDGRMFVKTAGLGLWHTTEDAQAFINLIGVDFLNDVQKVELAKVIGMNKVMESVTFTIREGTQTDEEKAEQAEANRTINRAIAVESFRAHQEITA
jgi:hypothetical protein